MSEEPRKAPAERIERGIEEAKRLKAFVASVTECMGLLHDGTCVKSPCRKRCPYESGDEFPKRKMDNEAARAGCVLYSPYVKCRHQMSAEDFDTLSSFGEAELAEFERIRKETC